ncbi:natriuretic peptides A [Parambassis ranga]|uniref:Natriuretic peptides A n=1 Tax=Parambassis ranga TaxID=210632 RepID=A0A6P7IKJ4_9TELE|nr:natriuretic peptides A [Parambassis ranga]
MKTVLLWGLLVLLCHQAAVSSHILRRPSSTSSLAQLKSLLEHFEETLAEAAQEENSEADYEGTNQESEYSQTDQGWNLDQEGDKETLISERTQPPFEGHSRSAIQRSRLQDLLMTARKRASGCFGARMDRIGNASGLGCNSGRGKNRKQSILN